MDQQTREIIRFTSGNAIGVIIEPVPVNPALALDQQLIVKIGVVDEEHARREPFPDEDMRVVTENLLTFLRGGTIQTDRWDLSGFVRRVLRRAASAAGHRVQRGTHI